jgi:hypothetical protein
MKSARRAKRGEPMRSGARDALGVATRSATTHGIVNETAGAMPVTLPRIVVVPMAEP